VFAFLLQFVKFSKTDMPVTAVVSDSADVAALFPRLFAPAAAPSSHVAPAEAYVTMTGAGASVHTDAAPNGYFAHQAYPMQAYGYQHPQFAYPFHPDPSYMPQFAYPSYVYPWGAYPGVEAVRGRAAEVSIVGRE
jgi:hypothetical protein